MERSKLKNLMVCGFEERLKVMFERNEEYAEEKDALIDFKRVAAICKIWKVNVTKPEDCAFLFRIAKIDRERNLLLSGERGKRLNDAFLDDPNYLDLQRALIQEANGES